MIGIKLNLEISQEKRTPMRGRRKTVNIVETPHYRASFESMPALRQEMSEVAVFLMSNTTQIVDSKSGRWVLWPTPHGWAYSTPSTGGPCLFGDRETSTAEARETMMYHVRQFEA